MNLDNISYQVATLSDLEAIECIRQKAFEPIFKSFRRILGDAIYEVAQMPEDVAQKEVLRSYFNADSIWMVWKVMVKSQIAGFIAIRLDEEHKVGEIGLNALDPGVTGIGLGAEMYRFAVAKMKEKGMKVATVATGGDPSHLPARKAYRNAGFSVEIPSLWMCQAL